MNYLNQNLLLVPGLICDDEIWAYPQKYLADIAKISILPMNEAVTMQSLAAAVLKNGPEEFVNLSREHINAYVLSFGARFMTPS